MNPHPPPPRDNAQPATRLRLPRTVSRRSVLQLGLAGLGAVALGPLGRRLPSASAAGPAGRKILVVLNCSGGNDTLNTVIPTLAEYSQVRGALAIPVADSISLDSGPRATTAYRLHPALPALKALWDEGAVSLVNRVGYPVENLSHFASQDIFSYGYRNAFPPGTPASGWIARFADRYAPTPTGAVALRCGRPKDFAGGGSNPLVLGSLDQFQLYQDGWYPHSNLQRANAVRAMLAEVPTGGLPGSVAREVGNAYELAAQVQAAVTAYAARPGRPSYSTGDISQALRECATLIFGGFDTRIFYTSMPGFDTHSAQGTTGGGFQPPLLAELDRAIGAFAADMKSQGTWDDVVIAVMTEFGRRNYPNGSAGTDHGHAFCTLLVGGAVASAGTGGTQGVDLVAGDLSGDHPLYAVDFRDILREILTDHLGADSTAAIFPEPQPSQATWGVI